MPQWKNFLIEIEKMEEKYGSTLREPATENEVIKLNHDANQKFENIVLPKSYIEFLNIVNGLDFNGLVIYGVDKDFLEKEVEEDIHGFIETNELWYENEWQKQYLFFGDSDTAWYCYDRKNSVFVERDKPSGTLMQSFENFDSMLSNALETILL